MSIVLLGATYMLWCRMPTGLHLHIGLPWRSVTVASANLPEPVSFTPAGPEVCVRRPRHGVYILEVQLVDGADLWSTFFQYDAGVRSRVDVFITPSTNAGCLHIRQTANRQEVLL